MFSNGIDTNISKESEQLSRNPILRLSSEENRRSLPILSIHNAHNTNQASKNQDSSVDNFVQMMKNNAPYASRSKQGKSRHKGRSNQSSRVQKGVSRFYKDDDFIRSYSDSAIILSHKHSSSDEKLHCLSQNPRRLQRSSLVSNETIEAPCPLISTTLYMANGGNPCKPNDAIQSDAMKNNKSLEQLSFKNFRSKNNNIENETILLKVDKYENMCHENYQEIVKEITTNFEALSELIEKRKIVLLADALDRYEHKLLELNNIKDNRTESSDSSSYYNGVSNTSPVFSNHVNGLDTNVMLDPLISNIPSTKDISYKESDKRCAKDLVQLAEGNMTFEFNTDDHSFLSNFGKLDENLSSAQNTVLSGYPEGNILVGDSIHMQIHTRDIHNKECFNSKDKVEVNIYNDKRKKICVQSIPYVAQKLDQILLFAEGSNDISSDQKNLFYSYNLKRAGKFEVEVMLNGVEIDSSPYTFVVYSRRTLTFENRISSAKAHRSLSSECMDESNCEQHDWIIKKGGKSCLLRTQGDKICQIYANEIVKDNDAWKIKLTSACADMMFSVGVATKTGIPQLDEEFICQFSLKGFNKMINRDRNIKRRESQFTRPPIMFSVLFIGNFIRVTSHELNKDRLVEVKLSYDKSSVLFPFCMVVHDHDELFTQVCPSPQITFL